MGATSQKDLKGAVDLEFVKELSGEGGEIQLLMLDGADVKVREAECNGEILYS
jgi:hypothetical protein